jgi:hypothetical protein
MTFSNFLKEQLTDFVECYRRYFWRTLSTVFIYTLLCFVAIAFLFKYSDFDVTASKKQISLLSYFFFRYSIKEVYSLVDLSKIVFIFFVAVFSLGLNKLISNDVDKKKELSFISFTKALRLKHVLYLVIALSICSAIDYCLFRADNYSEANFRNRELLRWLHSLLFLIRIYIPLILFSITLFKLIVNKPLRLTLKKLLFLFVSFWLFNEFAYEISIFIRGNIFSLILVSASEEKKYLYESLLGMPLVAFYFIGFYSAMMSLVRQSEKVIGD